MRKTHFLLSMVAVCLMLVGCSSQPQDSPTGTVPSFSLAWSEYPSWSVFGVAAEKGLIDGAQGKLGPVEEKWGVDIVLRLADYDSCITLYGNKVVDAACLTQLDSLAPSLGRPSVAVLPTSTSVGADACIVTGNVNVNDLKKTPTRGLEKSVSQYVFERCLAIQGENPKDFSFENMDPAAASQALQTNQNNVESIMVWNPFVLQTLRTRPDSRVLFDSSVIPEEVIDCVVVGKDSLEKPRGKDFACAVIDAYYQVNNLLANDSSRDETLVALGANFCSLGLDDMKTVVQQTRFYSTPDKALALFRSEKFRNETMPDVVNFCVAHDIVPADDSGAIRFGFDDPRGVLLNFSTEYIEQVQKSSN